MNSLQIKIIDERDNSSIALDFKQAGNIAISHTGKINVLKDKSGNLHYKQGKIDIEINYKEG